LKIAHGYERDSEVVPTLHGATSGVNAARFAGRIRERERERERERDRERRGRERERESKGLEDSFGLPQR